MTNDLELLNRWCEGDQRAGNDLCQRHFASIYRFFQSKVDGEVDELVQATFLACTKSREQFRKQSSFRTYLFTIARNQLYWFYRNKQRDQGALDFGVTSLADIGTTPTGAIARDQDRQRLLQALYHLPLDTQVLLELHYWEEMSLVDLAEVFEVPASTMRTRIHRARKALRETIEKLAKKPSPMTASVEDLDAWARSLRAGRSASKNNRTD